MKPIRILLLGFVLVAIFQGTAWAGLATPQGFQLGTPAPTTKSITQYGITWTFSEPIEYGQFVNGDYWVVDSGSSVKITGISPGYAITPRIINGSMINPSSDMQGYDNAIPFRYDAAKNVGIGISAESPLILSGNSSLVSTISQTTYPEGTINNSYVLTASVLTSVTSSPPAGSFRPGISGTSKTLHNIANVNFALLKKLAIPSGQTITATTLSDYANLFQKVWLDHDGSFLSRYMHQASSGLENYYYVKSFAEAALLLQLNFTDEEKRSLLINYIQMGIDLYSYLESGGIGWWPDGGNGNGRKWPILFAGIMLDYAPMKSIGQVSGDYINNGTFNTNGTITTPSGYKYFGEDGQTFYVNQYMVDISNSAYWNPDTRTAPNYPYTTAMIGIPEYGIKYALSPNESDSSWNANYRSIGTGAQAWTGFVLAARIMGVKNLWNHDAIFDYVDRYMEISAGRPDPFGYVVSGQSAGYRPAGILVAMWDTYRHLY